MDNLLALVGPTASGKTAVAVALAEALDGELISADAVAVYRGLDIGAAKPDASERARAAFHLIDICDPTDDFTVADFGRRAEEAIGLIRSRGRLPIVVGGTGLYVRAVAATLNLPEVPPQPELRARLWAEAEADGAPALHARLAQIDPVSARKIQAGDAKRIIRALEVWEVTGEPISNFHTPEGVHGVPKPGVCVFGLDRAREDLHRRIEARVDTMLAAGLVEEVRGLLAAGWPPTCKALGSLGYRHLIQYLQDGQPLTESVAELKRDTRRYARRQRIWFRNDPSVRWIAVGESETAEETAARILEEYKRVSV
jgi:tRNA dimethylallyltransferase